MLMTLLAAAAAFADTTPSCEPRLAVTRPFLYRLTKSGRTSHLLGTIHAGVRLTDFPAKVIQILDDATDVTLETITLAPTPEFRQHTQDAIYRLKGPSLQTELNPHEWDTLVRRLVANGFEPGVAGIVSPLGALELGRLDLAAHYERLARGRMDREIEADFLDRTAHGLESAADQLRAKVAAKDLRFLKHWLNAAPAKDADDGALNYRAGDDAALGQRLARDRAVNPRWYEIILTRRNADWAPRIELRHHRPGRHAFAVGAAHLFGTDGVLELLKARDFDVEREF